MLGFVSRRLLYLVPVLIAVSLLTFLVAALLPGDLAVAMLADEATPEKVAALRSEMGLDQPLVVQYLHWLGSALIGDLGRSLRTGEKVLSAILQRLPVTLELMLFAQLIALAIGVPLGILCAVRNGSVVDRVMTVIASASTSGGNASRISTPATTRVSTRPRKYPASIPSPPPMMRPINGAISPTVSEMRAPNTRRLRMSRPSASVPSQ